MENFFSSFNKKSKDNLAISLEKELKNKTPVFVCIGSDLILGDSLGPLVGTLLKNKKRNAYVYGTLNFPITAKEIDYARTYIKQMHPSSVIVAIDAAVGTEEEIGLIKIKDDGLMPGLGVKKDLGKIGDLSIIGIVATKSIQNNSLYNLTRLNLVYKIANVIADGIDSYIENSLINKRAI